MLKTLDFMLAYYKIHFKTMLEYKKSFAVSILTMAVNDIFMLFFWYVFFNVMPKINGWGFNELVLLSGFVAVAFGFFSIFFFGARSFSELVINGELDFFLLRPKDAFLHLSVSKQNNSALGEFIFGIFCLFLSGFFTPANLALFLALAFISGILFAFTFALINIVSFYIPKAETLIANLDNAAIHFSSYSASIFSGAIAFLLYFILPAFFISTLPVQSIISFSLSNIALLIGFTIVYSLAVYFLFNLALKRYESGNTIALRS